jgi:hypothetical protein
VCASFRCGFLYRDKKVVRCLFVPVFICIAPHRKDGDPHPAHELSETTYGLQVDSGEKNGGWPQIP